MEEVNCVVCGQPTRHARGTPRIRQVCPKHLGEYTEPVAIIRDIVYAQALAETVERNAARAMITLLERIAAEFDENARAHLERSAYRDCARRLRRAINDLQVLVPE